MIRRDFLLGIVTTSTLAVGQRALGVQTSPDSLPLKRGFVKTTLGADAWFEVHGNPKGPNVFLGGPVFSRTLVPANVALQTKIKEGYIQRLGDRYRLLMADYPHIASKVPDQTLLAVEDVCKDYLALADAAGMERFAAVGYSWSGNSMLQLATRSRRLSALVVGGWPAIDGPYKLLLETTGKLQQGSPEKREISRYVHYYESLQDWPERVAVAKLKCPRLNYIDVGDGEDTDFIGRLRKNKNTLHELGWETAEVNSGDGHFGGCMPETACPVIKEFLNRRLEESR
jgi:hypothetical protein